jgi:hypothetical protein
MKKKVKSTRKVSYVVWLENHTDRQDDEWKVVKAKSPEEARAMVVEDYDESRFSIGEVYRGTERQVVGI